jgi:hypothetical protein
VTLVAPIGPARIAAIRPAQPGPLDDPSEEGLGIEVVTEATMVPVADQVTAPADAGESNLDLSQRAFATQAASTIGSIGAIGAADPARVLGGDARGNAAVSTGFDRRPASNAGDQPRGDFASPLARAMSAFAMR